MGLIIITPLAGFVSPGSAILLGLLGGPVFLTAESWFARRTWFADPVGLLPGHLVGGLFGVLMIAFFAQHQFATGSGFPGLPNGLLFGGGLPAAHQLGIEVLGILTVMAVVFVLSFVTVFAIGQVTHGILDSESAPTAT
jgi:ammonium transporter, Amt family